ncbi:MAG: PH domain-containing protein [Planctomycetota bacterium]|nr:PH domain-containing protein [Planctomycetota bacterium]
MTPTAEPASPSVAGETLVPAKLLDEDEIVILAVKPSGWFVLLQSLPVLAVAVVVVVAAILAADVFSIAVAKRTVVWICAAAVCLQLLAAGCQWLGRLYVLTNRRMMRIRGVLQVDVFQCPLRCVGRATASATRLERCIGVGSLFFGGGQAELPDVAWIHVARPVEVQDLINETIRRIR